MISLPDKKYKVIYADPPWEVKAGPIQGRKYTDNVNSLPLTYNSMSVQDIEELKIRDIKDDNSVLFIWTVNKYIEHAYQIARSWGFTPSTMLVWDKTPKGIGLGGTFTLANEYLLFCRSGTLKASKRVKGNHWHFPREEHSKKPLFFRNLIQDVFNYSPKIELFARDHLEGWDVWGNQTPKTMQTLLR